MKRETTHDKTTHDRRNRTTKPRKDQNTRRKGYLQIFGNIGSGHHKKVERMEKNKERVSQENKETTRNQTVERKSHQRDKRLGFFFPCKILGIILEVDEGRT